MKKMNLLMSAGLLSSLMIAVSCQKQSAQQNAVARVLGVSNEIDDLAIGASEMEYYSGSETYLYEKTGVDHDLSFGSQITGGSVTLRIKNANGSEIYARKFSTIAGEVTTLSDASNPWTVEFDHENATGNFGLSLENAQ